MIFYNYIYSSIVPGLPTRLHSGGKLTVLIELTRAWSNSRSASWLLKGGMELVWRGLHSRTLLRSSSINWERSITYEKGEW